MTALYACLVSHERDAEELVAALRTAAADGVLNAVTARQVAGALEIRRAEAAVQVRSRDLGGAHDVLEGAGRRAFSVQFEPLTPTQEAVGLAWEVLVAATLVRPTYVWIGEGTYGADDIRQVAPIRKMDLAGAGVGLVLEPEEFDAFLRLPPRPREGWVDP